MSKKELSVMIGTDEVKPVLLDFKTDFPVIVTGSTGSGKTHLIRQIVESLSGESSADAILIEGKNRNELSDLDGSNTCCRKYGLDELNEILVSLISITKDRADNPENNTKGIVLVIDEFDDYLQYLHSDNEVEKENAEKLLMRLSQLIRISRGLGIYVVLSKQSLRDDDNEYLPMIYDNVATYIGFSKPNENSEVLDKWLEIEDQLGKFYYSKNYESEVGIGFVNND